MFKIDSLVLQKLCTNNSFQFNKSELIFFGLRGAVPVDESNYDLEEAHFIHLSDIDYRHPRCTFVQWLPKEEKLAIFPGSTVPHKKYIRNSLEKNGEGTNRLMTGHYNNYKKGYHKTGSETGHSAFRQINALPIRRTSDDEDYDAEDQVEFSRPFDNIHAAWCPGIDSDRYASAGCQVIVGYPKCKRRGELNNSGAWKVFHDNAYAVQQEVFSYILLNGHDALRVAENKLSNKSKRLRYGSTGEIVGILQKKLKQKNFYEGATDNQFGARTLFALLDFQSSVFGKQGSDGILGPMTSEALRINLNN